MRGIRSSAIDAVLGLRDVVEARVVHDRRRVAHLVDPFLVADLFEGVHRAGLHVVLEAERVADFVRHDVFEQAAHQVVGQRQLLRARIERAHLHEVPVAGQVHDVVIELDVRVEDLAGARIADVRAAGVLGGGGQPADDGVAHVFGTPVGVLLRRGRFLADDGVLEAGGLEGLVPVFDALLEPGHPLLRASRHRCSRRSASRARRRRRWGPSFPGASARCSGCARPCTRCASSPSCWW